MKRKPEYTTDDEKNFIRHLADENQTAFWNYFHIVTERLRHYDVGIDAPAIRSFAYKMARKVQADKKIAERGAQV